MTRYGGFALIRIVREIYESTALTLQQFFANDNGRRISTQAIMDQPTSTLAVPASVEG